LNQKGYKSIKYVDVQYFNITRNDRNKASSTAYQDSYEVSEILSTIREMPSTNEIEMRNKAIISLHLLTTPRISALQSARIESVKHIKHLKAWAFIQNPNWVNTKYAKTITSYFISDIEDIYEHVLSWQAYLLDKGFTNKDPLFPKIVPSFSQDGFQIFNLEKAFIKSQTSIRTIFSKAFKANGLPYYKLHAFRHALVRHALMTPYSGLIISALDQNMGRTMDVGVIISSYGTTPEHQRAKVLKEFKLE
jgi:hypothetical protein